MGVCLFRTRPLIKRATQDDLAEILRIGERFYLGSVWSGVVEFDPEHFARFALQMMRGEGAIFLSDDGMCGGMLAPVYFSSNAKIASELFWHCEDGKGQELHQAFEDWARQEGAEIVHMTGQANAREKGIRRLYRARGYEAKEIGFFKEL